MTFHLFNIKSYAISNKVHLEVEEDSSTIKLNNIISYNQGEGFGTKVMQKLIQYAKLSGKNITLVADAGGFAETNRLRTWYKSLGFEDIDKNWGTMIYRPKKDKR